MGPGVGALLMQLPVGFGNRVRVHQRVFGKLAVIDPFSGEAFTHEFSVYSGIYYEVCNVDDGYAR